MDGDYLAIVEFEAAMQHAGDPELLNGLIKKCKSGIPNRDELESLYKKMGLKSVSNGDYRKAKSEFETARRYALDTKLLDISIDKCVKQLDTK